MRDEGRGCSRFQVPGSRFKVQGLTWNFELGTLNGVLPDTRHSTLDTRHLLRLFRSRLFKRAAVLFA